MDRFWCWAGVGAGDLWRAALNGGCQPVVVLWYCGSERFFGESHKDFWMICCLFYIVIYNRTHTHTHTQTQTHGHTHTHTHTWAHTHTHTHTHTPHTHTHTHTGTHT